MGKTIVLNAKEINEREAREAVFKATMKNLKPFGFNEEGKIILGTGDIPLNLLYVDMRYQGMRTHKNINKLIAKWDIRKLTPIILVPHPEENRFAIVDGQGRYLAAPKVGLDSLNAIVLMDVPSDPEERLRFEAEYFIGQGTEDEKMRPVEKHLSRVICNDQAALDIDEMQKKYGFKFLTKSGQREAGIIGSYTELYKTSSVYGIDCLDYIFDVCKQAGFDRKANGYSKFVIRLLSSIWKVYPQNREETKNFLGKYLRSFDPVLLRAKGQAKYDMLHYYIGASLFLEDVLVENLNLTHKRRVEGKQVIPFSQTVSA